LLKFVVTTWKAPALKFAGASPALASASPVE
jgi:hypothetical protein